MSGRDRVAFALAVGVGVFIVVLGCSVLYATVDPAQTVTAEAVSLVSAVVGGVVGALAVYIGDGSRRPPDDPPSDGTPEP